MGMYLKKNMILSYSLSNCILARFISITSKLMSNNVAVKICSEIDAESREPSLKKRDVSFNFKSLENNSYKSFILDEKLVSIDTISSFSFKQSLLKLAKIRLSALVVITSASGFVLSPQPFDTKTFIGCLLGTAFFSFAAASTNQLLEIPFDAQMSRTRLRPLVTHAITPLFAATFSLICISSGVILYSSFTNSLTLSLGVLTYLLYTSVYTPLKRHSALNTSIGAIVGALPPLIGYSASSSTLSSSAFFLGFLLFAWQFPHFHSLSWSLRDQYSRAGYAMSSCLAPSMCTLSSLIYSTAILFSCLLSPLITVFTSLFFSLLSLYPNLKLFSLAFKFYISPSVSTSRKLFRFTLLHLPILMVLLILDSFYMRDFFLQLTNEISLKLMS